MTTDKIEQQLKGQSSLKEKAAKRAVDFVESGMILGLGTGSTIKYALEFIGQKIQKGLLQSILGIPSSLQTEKLAKKFSIPLTTLENHPEIDMTIDGADEVDPNLNLIKGGGGALLREKILAQASKRNLIIIDDSKLSPRLGTLFPVPVEVIPFAWKVEANYLESLQSKVVLRKNSQGAPIITDQNNFVLDAHFGPIQDAERLAFHLNQRAGIVEHGLFLGLTSEVVVADKEGTRHLKR